jgi:hypothetical protein
MVIGANVAIVINDTSSIVVNKRFSFTRRALWVRHGAVDVEIPVAPFKYLELLFNTYAALEYKIAAQSHIQRATIPLI